MYIYIYTHVNNSSDTWSPSKVLGEDATPFGPNPLAPSTIVVKTTGSAGQVHFGGLAR